MRIRNALAQTRNVPRTLWWREVPLGRDVPNVKLRGMDGAVAVGGDSLEPREFDITGTLQAPQGVPKAEARRRLVYEVDELLGFLQQGPLEITRSGQDDRILRARLVDQTLSWQNPYDWLEVTLSFRADDPYWYSWRTAEEAASLNNGQFLTVTTVGGNAPIYPLVRFIGRAQTQNPKLLNLTTGQSVQYVGTIPNTQILEIDTSRSHATLQGVGAVSKMSPLPFFWTLQPGVNRLKLEAGGSAGLYMSFRERWL